MLKKKNKIKVFFAISENNHLKGGGFNFLRFLNYKFKKKNLLSKSVSDSNIILINSHHNFIWVILYKLLFPLKIFVHRIDGPISKYVGKKDLRDYLVKLLNNYVADATIFQSNWSFKNKNFSSTKNFKIIHNSADTRFYNFKKVKKIKNSIILCSWSSNLNKGFKYYSYLDRNVNFRKYKISFIGNSPIKFKNISIAKALTAKKLSKIMLKHEIYLTASKNDPCSNSLIEALELKLPSLVLNSGGHTEILKNRGLDFKNEKDLLNKINFIFKNKKTYLGRFKKKNLILLKNISIILDLF